MDDRRARLDSAERRPSWSQSDGAPTAAASRATTGQNSARRKTSKRSTASSRDASDDQLCSEDGLTRRTRTIRSGVRTILDTVPEEELAARWQLTLGEEYPPGACGRVWRADRNDGTGAVLKVMTIVDLETRQEADALERWDGDGAVRLLARDDERNAMLLERCDPGTPLSRASTEEAMDVICALLPRLWKDAEGFLPVEEYVPYLEESLATCTSLWLKDSALAYLRDLVPSQGERVLVHQDLHGENILAAEREPWLVIDPKPLAAERELQAASIIRSPELGHSRRATWYRLDRLCELGLDRERMIGWTVAHTAAWSGGAHPYPEQIDAVRWLATGR
jgi:streptomycin 6-kinase